MSTGGQSLLRNKLTGPDWSDDEHKGSTTMHIARMGYPILLFVFFLSGSAGLIYQIAWMRKLVLFLGVTSQAVSVVLAIFMGGLALGSWLLGQYGDRVGSAVRLYALLELGIAIFGLLSPFLLDALGWGYVWLVADESYPLVLSTILRIGVATLALIIPTTLMGATLPILIRGVRSDSDTSGRSRIARDEGFLYSINTLGAVLGTIVTAGFLVKE